ncbi:MAG TPA: dynamin family protein [Solirubrobacteraceae bacterium]|nr:dynamin family protein [Solirubrobacteraceae bacterium]
MASTDVVHGFGGQLEPTAVTGTESTRAGRRELTVHTLDEVLSLATGLLPERSVRDLAAARVRVAQDRFNLVVLGEFKRGKSTLINALLGRSVLPTAVIPLTSVVTAIGAGDHDRLVVRYVDGREEDRPLSEISDYVTEGRNPGNRLGVELARVELDHDLLAAGLELVDTPGIGSIHSHNTAVAREFLPRVDAAICVLDAGQPLSQAERELLLELTERVPRLLIVINKIDHLEPADRDVAVEFIRSALRDLIGDDDTEVFAVSARRREGLSRVARRLRTLADDEREALLLSSVARLAQSVATDTAQTARFEIRATQLPLEQLDLRAVTFEQRIADLEVATVEAGDLLDRGIERALEKSVNEPLRLYARREEARLREELRNHADESRTRSPRELSSELEGWIEATIRAEFERLVPQFEAAIGGELTERERNYAARIERILEQVQQTAEDVFGARASDVLPDTGLREPSAFSFKLKDPEHGLDMLVGFGRTVTPGALGRRLVMREAEQRLIDMADRHAGRLRSELAGRVVHAVREYRRELSAGVDEAIDAIRAAIERAGADRRQGERHAQARLEHLAQIERRCTQLAAELNTVEAANHHQAGGSDHAS